MATDPKEFGKRITEALEEKGWDVKTLQEALQERTKKARGTSYGAVWAYVNGQGPPEPRTDVVEAMAALLGRYPAFLLHGTGPRGPGEEAEAQAADNGPSILDNVLEGVANGIGKGANHLLSGGVRRAAVVYTWRVLMFSVLGERLWREGQRGEGPGLPAMIGKALRAPFDVLGEDPGEVPEAAVTEYVLGACTALRALAHEKPPPSPSIKEESHDEA